MAANNKANVSVIKGVVGGYVFVAPYGTALPTDATSTLNQAFSNVGYVGEDGITHAKSRDITHHHDLNGEDVAVSSEGSERTVTLKFIELNATAFGEAYGVENVTDTSGAITFTDNDNEMPERSLVFELVLKDGRRYRRVEPRTMVTEWGDQVDVSTELGGFELTYTKLADDSGNYEYGYLAAPTPKAAANATRTATKE